MSKEGDIPPSFGCVYQRRQPLPSPTEMEKECAREMPTVSSSQEQRRARVMKTLKEAMLKISMSRNPARYRSRSQQKWLARRIDYCLPSMIPSQLHTQNHPSYAEMIKIAVQDLNKKGGSSKASISRYITEIYEILPLAHDHLVSHHLEKLVKMGEIVSVAKSRYTLPVHSDTNNENLRQEEEHQLIVAGEKNVRETVNGGALVAITEKCNLRQEGEHQIIVAGGKTVRETVNGSALVAITEECTTPVVVCCLKALPKKHSNNGKKNRQKEGERLMAVGGNMMGEIRTDGALVALPEQYLPAPAVEMLYPLDVIDDGVNSTALPENLPTALTEVESMRDDAGIGGDPKHSATAVDCCLKTLSKNQQKEGVQLMAVGEIGNYDVDDGALVALPEQYLTTPAVEFFDPLDVIDDGVGPMALPENPPMALTEVESMGDDDGIVGEPKQSPTAVEAPDFLQKQLPGSNRGNRLTKQNIVKQQKIEIVKNTATTPSTVGNPSQGEQPRRAGRPAKNKYKGRRNKLVASQDDNRELKALSDEYPTPPEMHGVDGNTNQQEIVVGENMVGESRDYDANAGALVALPAIEMFDPVNVVDFGGGSALIEVHSMSADAGVSSVSKPSIVEATYPFRKMMLRSCLGKRSREQNEVEEQQLEIDKTGETAPSTAIVVAAQGKQSRPRGRPPQKKFRSTRMQDDNRELMVLHDNHLAAVTEAVPLQCKYPIRSREKPIS